AHIGSSFVVAFPILLRRIGLAEVDGPERKYRVRKVCGLGVQSRDRRQSAEDSEQAGFDACSCHDRQNISLKVYCMARPRLNWFVDLPNVELVTLTSGSVAIKLFVTLYASHFNSSLNLSFKGKIFETVLSRLK